MKKIIEYLTNEVVYFFVCSFLFTVLFALAKNNPLYWLPTTIQLAIMVLLYQNATEGIDGNYFYFVLPRFLSIINLIIITVLSFLI